MAVGSQVGKTFVVPPATYNACTTCTIFNNTSGGTIPANTYYVAFTFTANGFETNVNNANQTFTTTGTTSSVGFQVGAQYVPSGSTAMNIYLGTSPSNMSFQASGGVAGNQILVTSISTTGRPLPQWNQTSFQDINLSALGLTSGNEFIIHNIYYNNPVAMSIFDGTNLVAYDGDTTNGGRLGMAIHCNGNQWLRVANQGTTSNVSIAVDGVQTA